jgi:hypothetical protein
MSLAPSLLLSLLTFLDVYTLHLYELGGMKSKTRDVPNNFILCDTVHVPVYDDASRSKGCIHPIRWLKWPSRLGKLTRCLGVAWSIGC